MVQSIIYLNGFTLVPRHRYDVLQLFLTCKTSNYGKRHRALICIGICVVALTYNRRTYVKYLIIIINACNSLCYRKGKRRVSRMVCVVVLAFAVCWLPIQVSFDKKSMGHDLDGNLFPYHKNELLTFHVSTFEIHLQCI